MIIISHITSIHYRYDTRIYHKMCKSLSNNDKYKVYLCVYDGSGDEIKDNINILDLKKYNFNRKINVIYRLYVYLKHCINNYASIYHLHDPELIILGYCLKLCGRNVVFDSHEDVPLNILTKKYLPFYCKVPICMVYVLMQNVIFPKFNGLIAATPFIRSKLSKININTEVVNNFPIIKELNNHNNKRCGNDISFCYVGVIDECRGINEMVAAMANIKNKECQLLLGGKFTDLSVRNNIVDEPGWKYVKELGWLERNEIRQIFKSSIAGFVLFHTYETHIDALPVKMFEYMCAGLPVIVSNFPLWERIINKNKCGIYVNPNNILQITNAMELMINDRNAANEMGINGQKAVIKDYNWKNEFEKMSKFYIKIIENR